jgi:phospholipase C
MSSKSMPLPGIEHIVVLMLENRSFDNVLGGLGAAYNPPKSQAEFNGLIGSETNPTSDKASGNVQVWQATSSEGSQSMPYPDPGEFFDDMSHQIYGYTFHLGVPIPNSTTGTPNMQGFAINYSLNLGTPVDIMQYYNPNNLPITSWLALLFGVSDQWYASAPCQTFANRVFAICATPGLRADGKSYVDDTNYFSVPIPDNITQAYGHVSDLSIFELFDLQYPDSISTPNWKIYYHDTPLSSLVSYVNNAAGWDASNPSGTTSVNVVHFDDSDYGALPDDYRTFSYDVLNDSLPMYSVIEPRYYANWTPSNLPPNNNHPGSNLSFASLKNGKVSSKGPAEVPITVDAGEVLLADVVLALYSNFDVAAKTLLIVTYDEHGGLYDHVPPPTNVPSPFTSSGVTPFDYTRLGVRVPAIFINPYISTNTVFRPAASETYPYFDHTSIIHTLRKQFGLKTGLDSSKITKLTDRDEQMPDLSGLITLADARPMEELFDLEELKAKRQALVK